MKTNDKNLHGNRTATQIKSILKSNGINCKVDNLGSGREFDIVIESTIKNRYLLKKIGFILCRGLDYEKYITVKAY
jgi:hypothetical protein